MPNNEMTSANSRGAVLLTDAPAAPLVPQPCGKLAEALSRARDRCRAVSKGSYNAHHKYDYADADAIIEEAKSALADSGIEVVPLGARPTVVGSGGALTWTLSQVFELMHSSGESRLITFDWPVVPGAGRPLDKAYASALTSSLAYFYRGLLLMSRKLEPDEQTMDGRDDRPVAQRQANEPEQQPTVERITENQEAELSRLLRDSGSNVANFLAHYGIPVVAKLPAEKYAAVVNRLEAVVAKLAPKPDGESELHAARLRVDDLLVQAGVTAEAFAAGLQKKFGHADHQRLTLADLLAIEAGVRAKMAAKGAT